MSLVCLVSLDETRAKLSIVDMGVVPVAQPLSVGLTFNLIRDVYLVRYEARPPAVARVAGWLKL